MMMMMMKMIMRMMMIMMMMKKMIVMTTTTRILTMIFKIITAMFTTNLTNTKKTIMFSEKCRNLNRFQA